MGKGYNNFMCKKPFHPGSRDNIKRVWMAQQRDTDAKTKEDEMRMQYEKEQELYTNRLLVSTESKEKLSLNFMYEAPAGVKKDHVKEDGEPEFKFEWQRHAPRESFAKNNMEIRDQPFGIQVRNVRCLKCHKWGHVNTDRECPLFAASATLSILPEATKVNPEELVKAMKEDGLALKKSLIGQSFDANQANQLLIPKEEDDPEMAFLKSLSKKQKKKLLRKLDRLSGKSTSVPKKKKKDKKKKRRSSSSSDKSSDDETRIEKHSSSKSDHKRRHDSNSDVTVRSSGHKSRHDGTDRTRKSRHHSSDRTGKEHSRDERKDSHRSEIRKRKERSRSRSRKPSSHSKDRERKRSRSRSRDRARRSSSRDRSHRRRRSHS